MENKFEIDESFDDYAFGIHLDNFEYTDDEINTVKTIVEKYSIDELEVYTLVDFVKRELPSLQHKDLLKHEIDGIKSFIDSGNKVENISFRGKDFSFNIKDPDLIEVLSKYIRKRYNFVNPEGDKSFKKLVARTLYKRLTEKLKQKDYDAKIIIGLIFAPYHIALVNDPILTEKENSIKHPGDNYLNYLERKIRSFLTD
ncbi:MAG: hypothetical protein R6W78_04695 [Bacteroidales bacterium]